MFRIGPKALFRHDCLSLFAKRRRRGISTDAPLPLTGVKVLDMTRVLAGPYCTQILGDLGAEVLKLEHPTKGDDTRAWGPPYAENTDGSEGRESAYFLCANRNKKSVGISFKHTEGQAIIHELIKKSDVLVENYLPGTLKRYDLGYEQVKEINPRLVYASITGYGQTGPYAPRAGYDVMVEAEFGLMHITGHPCTPPAKVGVAVTDLTTGLYTVSSILAALLHRHTTGAGQYLDVALSDCQTATLANIASSVLISGQPDSGRHGTAHPSIVPYESFPTLDDAQGGILLGGGNDRLFSIMCERLGPGASWSTDARFKTNADRVRSRKTLVRMISEVTRTKTTQEWLEIFEGSGMPYAPINDVQTTLHHEHTKARGMVQKVTHPTVGEIRVVQHPVKWSACAPGVRTPPPTLGQHTEEVLGSVLGMEREEVEALRQRGVVGY